MAQTVTALATLQSSNPANAIGGGVVPDEFTDWNFRLKGSRF
jgi:hypothetical protein